MPPLFKTWLTLCLLLPLAAHATNREQRLPNGFTGYTTNASVKHAPSKHSTLRARPSSSAAKAHNLPVAAMSPKQSSDVLSRAVNVLGTPYVWGGSSPKKGFDCSGLVKYAFNDVADVDLPRTSNAMAQGHGIGGARQIDIGHIVEGVFHQPAAVEAFFRAAAAPNIWGTEHIDGTAEHIAALFRRHGRNRQIVSLGSAAARACA